MKYYVRKITLSKYPKPPLKSYEVSSLKADAVADVRTSQDKLSIWEIASDADDSIDEAILALVTSSRQERFDRIDVVVFSEEVIESEGLALKSEERDTAVSDLCKTHQNIVNLTYESLSSVLKIISDITIRGNHIRRDAKQIEALIKKNIKRINLNRFTHEDIKKKINELTVATV